MTTALSDRDLCRVRLRFFDLLKSFFQDEPDVEQLSRWRGIFAALEKEHIAEPLDTTVRQLAKLLAETSLQQIQGEHYALFVDPYSNRQLPLTASHYLDGKNYGPSLAAFRDILKQGKLIRESGVTEPEDSLPIMLDTLISLIQDEKHGTAETRQLQDTLLQTFLVPTVKGIKERIEQMTDVLFYQKCIAFLHAYLDLEQGLLGERNTAGCEFI